MRNTPDARALGALLFLLALLVSVRAGAQQFSAVPKESFDYDQAVDASASPDCPATLALDRLDLLELLTGIIVPGGASGSITPASLTFSTPNGPPQSVHLHATLAANAPVGTGKAYSIIARLNATTCNGFVSDVDNITEY